MIFVKCAEKSRFPHFCIRAIDLSIAPTRENGSVKRAAGNSVCGVIDCACRSSVVASKHKTYMHERRRKVEVPHCLCRSKRHCFTMPLVGNFSKVTKRVWAFGMRTSKLHDANAAPQLHACLFHRIPYLSNARTDSLRRHDRYEEECFQFSCFEDDTMLPSLREARQIHRPQILAAVT